MPGGRAASARQPPARRPHGAEADRAQRDAARDEERVRRERRRVVERDAAVLVDEGPLHPAIPAIANAIWDAVGIRLRTMPFTPERVLQALREKGVA